MQIQTRTERFFPHHNRAMASVPGVSGLALRGSLRPERMLYTDEARFSGFDDPKAHAERNARPAGTPGGDDQKGGRRIKKRHLALGTVIFAAFFALCRCAAGGGGGGAGNGQGSGSVAVGDWLGTPGPAATLQPTPGGNQPTPADGGGWGWEPENDATPTVLVAEPTPTPEPPTPTPRPAIPRDLPEITVGGGEACHALVMKKKNEYAAEARCLWFPEEEPGQANYGIPQYDILDLVQDGSGWTWTVRESKTLDADPSSPRELDKATLLEEYQDEEGRQVKIYYINFGDNEFGLFVEKDGEVANEDRHGFGVQNPPAQWQPIELTLEEEAANGAAVLAGMGAAARRRKKKGDRGNNHRIGMTNLPEPQDPQPVAAEVRHRQSKPRRRADDPHTSQARQARNWADVNTRRGQLPSTHVRRV